MRRTQIYLTEEQHHAIAARAADAGTSKAEVVRGILDRGLGLDPRAESRRRAIAATAGILADHEDWPEWLERVRGAAADRRLRGLSL